jgi:prolyl oligopeptidase
MKKIVCLICCIGALKCFAQYNYPATKTVDSTDTYFGVTYHDPYRWLEHMKDTSVVSWFKKQSQFSDDILNRINGRDSLIDEWRMLAKLQPASVQGILYENGRLFYKKTTPGEKVAKLYWRQGENGKEILLFDPQHYIEGKTFSIQDFAPSFDGNMLAIGYAQKGAEIDSLRIMDVNTGRFLKEVVYPSRAVEGWTPDNRSIFYLALNSGSNTDMNVKLNVKTKMHAVGSDPSTDLDFFSSASYPELNIPAKAYPGVGYDENNPGYILASVNTVQRDMTAYFARVASANTSHIAWKPICTPADHLVRSMTLFDGRIYAITYANAKNFRLVSSPIDALDWSHAKVEVAEKADESIKSFTRTKDYLLLDYSNGITDRLYRFNLHTGKTDLLQLPIDGNVTIIRPNCYNVKTNNCLLTFTSNLSPTREFELDAATGKFIGSPFNAPPAYPKAYTSLIEKNVEVKGHDGVMVPLTILYRKGTKLDGSNVCLMDSYGAYGVSMDPAFFVYEISLAVRGVIVAIPHVRGGSEKGQDWYMAGYKTTKPNT